MLSALWRDVKLTGLAQHGYRTVCIGGVTYFSRGTPLGAVLPDMFDEDHWRPEFCSPKPDSTRHQVDHALTVAEQYADRPLFLFVNVSATHVPHGHYTGDSGDSWRSSPPRSRTRTNTSAAWSTGSPAGKDG